MDLIDKNKIRADNYITILLVVCFLLFAIFFPLDALLSIIVYPFASLTCLGILNIVSVLEKRNYKNHGKLNKILSGIIYINFSVLILWFILTQPNIASQRIVALIAFPMLIVAFAGIIKGSIIDIYSLKYRRVNIYIGIITFIICMLVLLNVMNNFLFNIIVLSLTLLINILSRAALYLSEFGLSIVHIKNLRLFLYIISDYLINIDRNGNLILSKIE